MAAGRGSRIDAGLIKSTIGKWLVDGGQRLSEVNRRVSATGVLSRTLSDPVMDKQLSGNTAPADGSSSLHSKTVITLGDSRLTSQRMLPTETTIAMETLVTPSDWISQAVHSVSCCLDMPVVVEVFIKKSVTNIRVALQSMTKLS